MARTRSKCRRLTSERSGVPPRLWLRQALSPQVAAADALVGTLFVLAIVAVLNYGVLADLAHGRASTVGLQALGGTLLVVGGLAVVGAVYLARFQRTLVTNWRRLLVYGACSLACVAAAKALMSLDPAVAPPWRSLAYLTPLSAFAIFFAVVYGQREAIAASFLLAILVGLAVQMSHPSGWSSAEALPVVIVLLCGALVAVLATRKIRIRIKLLNVGLLVALVHVGLMLGFELLRGRMRFGQPPRELLWGAANGLGAGILMTLLLPLIELVFNIATDIRLLELSDQEQPLLRLLVTRAPSTDNHSRRVAILAEAAAESIGANSLLARVASYYHDIGKIVKPEYFVENQAGGESPHNRLRPSMSSLIIAAHTKDGVELAQEAGLPRAITDIIAQHHGTSVIEFFYSRYLEEAGERPLLDASFFRYAGPRPATREAAIVMLADSVEAASRTLPGPLPSRIETLVKRITTARLLDGQLEGCRLALSDLYRIEQSFFRVLCSMFHARIEYPATDLDRAARRARGLRSAASSMPS